MNKKERNPITVFLTMFVLLLPILLPPIFRNLFPKENIKPTTSSTNELKILQCMKTVKKEQCNVSSRTFYNIGGVNKVVITYTIIENLQQTEGDNIDTYSALTELENLKQFPEIGVVQGEKQSTITINKNSLNNVNDMIKTYLQDIKNQQKHYENLGFTCNIIES